VYRCLFRFCCVPSAVFNLKLLSALLPHPYQRRYLAIGVATSVGPCLEWAARELSDNGDTQGAATLWERAAALDNLQAMCVWEGITHEEATMRVFGPDSDGTPRACISHPDGSPGMLSVSAAEASELGIDLDARFRCAGCQVPGRLGNRMACKVTVQWKGGSDTPLQPAAPLLTACSGCRVMLYCSKDCQRTHWKAGGHKGECATLAAAAAARREEATMVLPSAVTVQSPLPLGGR
jgi:hypothetical protein